MLEPFVNIQSHHVTFRLTLQIALRHLAARKRQTALATLGVALGGGIFALMVGITTAQQEFLEERLIDVSPHLLVTADRLEPITRTDLLANESHAVIELRVNVPPSTRKEVKPYTEIAARIEQLGSEITAVAPYCTTDAIVGKGTRTVAVNLRGVDPLRERTIGHLEHDMIAGSLADLGRFPHGVAVGAGLAQKLNVGLGGVIDCAAPGGRVEQLVVAAIFRSGVAGVDDRRAYVNLPLVQAILHAPRNAVSGLGVAVRDVNDVGRVKRLIENATGYRVETWQETNQQILAFQERQTVTSRLLVIVVFVTAAFGIANTLVAVVMGKKLEIAAMKSFGVSRSAVGRIFLVEGLVIGLVGGVLAAALGYALASIVGGMHLLPGSSDRAFVRFDRFPVSLDPLIYIGTTVGAVVMAVAASYFPARRAARFVPVRIIRGA